PELRQQDVRPRRNVVERRHGHETPVGETDRVVLEPGGRRRERASVERDRRRVAVAEHSDRGTRRALREQPEARVAAVIVGPDAGLAGSGRRSLHAVAGAGAGEAAAGDGAVAGHASPVAGAGEDAEAGRAAGVTAVDARSVQPFREALDAVAGGAAVERAAGGVSGALDAPAGAGARHETVAA